MARLNGGLFVLLLNNHMELKESKKSNRGGARANAGRPKGTTDRVTIAGLLGAIEDTNGQSYLEILAEDFAQARTHDKNLTQKYHHLILNKVAATLTNVEVTDSEDHIAAKALAFQEALAKLQALHEENK